MMSPVNWHLPISLDSLLPPPSILMSYVSEMQNHLWFSEHHSTISYAILLS